MDIIIGLFWIGFLIIASMFVFNIVIGLILGFFGVIAAGFGWVFNKLRGQ